MKKQSSLILVPRRGVVATAKAVKATIAKRRTRTRRPNQGQSGSGRFLNAYTNTLNDPFDYAGVPLGYDCFLPTTLSAAYVRSSLVVNADGSFALSFMPDPSNMVQPFNGTASASHTGPWQSAANISSLTGNFREGRVVSGGLRCFALFPETAAPGVLFSGTAPDMTRVIYQGVTTNNLSGLPGSRIGIGSKGAVTTIRPYDNGSFEFFNANITGLPVDGIPYMTSSYICGLGFPVGTVIWYEAILNIECIAVTSSGSSAVPADDMAAPTAASSFFPTVGQLYSAAQQYLSPSVIMDGIDATASLVTGNYGRAANSLSRAAMGMGSGRNFNSFSQRRSRENTVAIEEMEMDAQPSSSRGYVRVR
jgi:hypothetical protein